MISETVGPRPRHPQGTGGLDLGGGDPGPGMYLSFKHSIDEGGDLIAGQPQVGEPPSIHGAQFANRAVTVPPALD